MTTPVIEAKLAALEEYKRTPSERNLQILRIATSKAQQTAPRCANECWTELSENIQTAAITGNIRGMYDGIKKTLGPTLNKTAPLRSSTGEVIPEREHQLERWVKHYSDFYSRQNIVSPSALDDVEYLPTMETLDTEPTLEELSKAIDSLASGTTPGSIRIPPRPNQSLHDRQRRSLPESSKDRLLTTNMKGTVQFNGSSSWPFDISRGVKQDCVLAPTLFGIFFALLLRHAFDSASEGICLRTRLYGRLFSLGRLGAKTTVREALIRDMLFADDAAVTTHT